MINEEKIYHLLRKLIFNAELPPGQQLKESSLAEAFGVSRTPIRSVLQRLKFDSLIEIIPQKGAFVYCPNPKEAKQIFFVRKLLEPEATSLAAVHVTRQQLDEMYQLIEEETFLYNSHEVNRALVKTNDLHMKIIEASKNVYLIECLRKIVSLSHIILAFYDVSDLKESKAETEHIAIVDAIKDGNSSLAKKLAAMHVPSIESDVDYSKSFVHLDSISRVIGKYLN